MRAAPSKVADLEHALVTAQAAYLGRVAPGHRTRRVRWSGGATQVIELGDGPPVVLVHGGLGEAFQWGPLLAPLARRRRVIAVDRPGHGLADPFDYRRADLFDHARRFLGEVLDALALPAAPLVANSMGGLFSVAFALRHHERVPRLVLVGSPAGVTRALPLPLRLGTVPVLKWVARALMRRPTADSVRNFWKQLLVAHAERLDDDFLHLSALSQRRNAESWFTLIERTCEPRGFRRELLLAERWRDLAMPTTLVWGERDAFAPLADGESACARSPRLRMVRIADAGHSPWFDDPARVAAAIESALDGDFASTAAT